jgi:hypothetical protein
MVFVGAAALGGWAVYSTGLIWPLYNDVLNNGRLSTATCQPPHVNRRMGVNQLTR